MLVVPTAALVCGDYEIEVCEGQIQEQNLEIMLSSFFLELECAMWWPLVELYTSCI